MELDYDRVVSRAHLEAAGWNLGIFQHSNPFECHVIYVRDFRTDHIELFTITMKDFDSLTPSASAAELSGLVMWLLKRHQKGRLSKKHNQALLPALAGYVKGTRNYRTWRDQASPGERLHAVLNLYPHQGGIVRPFAVLEKGTVVSAEKLLAVTDQAQALDRTNHPEWFR